MHNFQVQFFAVIVGLALAWLALLAGLALLFDRQFAIYCGIVGAACIVIPVVLSIPSMLRMARFLEEIDA